MTTSSVIKQKNILSVVLGLLLSAAILLSFGFRSGQIVKAEDDPADGQHTAEITLVSKDKEDLDFIYLSGLVLQSEMKGVSYDKSSNTLTLNNVELSKDNTHYSLTISNMGENFRLNIAGSNSLDYLSLESIGYDTGCTITGSGTLNLGYLDISTDGNKLNVTVDNSVNLNIDSQKMGYENLPAIKVTSKTQLTAMESIIQILGNTDDKLVYEENPSSTSYAYETTASKITITSSHVVKKGADGKWGYYNNEKLESNYTGLAGNSIGLWRIENGLVNFSYNGLCQGQNGWYMVKDGLVDTSFNGIAANENGRWFVQDGRVQFSYVGPVVINGEKFTVDKGLVK